jgi:hypothetical protein
VIWSVQFPLLPQSEIAVRCLPRPAFAELFLIDRVSSVYLSISAGVSAAAAGKEGRKERRKGRRAPFPFPLNKVSNGNGGGGIALTVVCGYAAQIFPS